MSKLLHIGLIALLAALLSPAALVEATCGQCYTAHTCTSNTTFQLCYNGVPNTNNNFTCPANKPICTEYGDICMPSGTTTACGDTSSCAQCSNGETYACASLTTFGRCDGGELLPDRSICPTDYFCSVSGAAAGNPCVLTCEPDNADTCDRVEIDSGTPDPEPITTTTSSTTDNTTTTDTTTTSTDTTTSTTDTTTTDTTSTSTTTDSTTSTTDTTTTDTSSTSTTTDTTTTDTTTSTTTSTTTDTTTTDTSTSTTTDTTSTDTTSTTTDTTSTDTTSSTTTTTTPAPAVDANVHCQGVQKAGRFAIPNDTVCTSFINCFYRASTWQGSIVACQADKPYFNAINACGIVKPTNAGCL